MECSCSIDGCCDEGTYEEYEEKILTHESNHVDIKCGECNRQINCGEKFEWFCGEYDGDRHTHHTCMDCISLRENFFSDWAFERLWEDFVSHMEYCDWQVPEKCLAKITAPARAKICGMIENYWCECEKEEQAAKYILHIKENQNENS